MPRYRITTIISGTNTYELHSISKDAAEEHWFALLESSDLPAYKVAQYREDEYINKIDKVKE